MTKKMLTITSDPHNLSQVEEYLITLKSEYKICDDRFPDILVSLTEAVNNAIIHGNKVDHEKKVSIETIQENAGLVFNIKDEGDGFNPSSIPDPCSPERIERCGGRGVHIMSHLCDKLSFMDNGSTVSLFFKMAL